MNRSWICFVAPALFLGCIIMSARALAQCTPPPAAAACMDPSSFTITLAPGDGFGQTFSVTTGAAPIQKVDVVFAIDRTGSMSDEINVVKANALTIMDGIRSRVADASFGVVSFMDYPGSFIYPGYGERYGDAGDVPFEVNRSVTSDRNAVATAIQGLWLGSGADGPQDYTRVLYEALGNPGVGWRSDSKHVLVMFGDAPTHDLNFAGYNFGGDPGPDGIALTPDDLDFETVVQELRDAGLVVEAVDSGTDAYSEATFKGMSESFRTAVGTRGKYFRLDSASQIPEAVQELVGAEARIIHQLSLQVAAPYSDWLLSVAPSVATEVGPNETVDFMVTFVVPIGTPSGEYAFALRAVGDGTFLAFSSITVTVPSAEVITDLGFRPDPGGFRFGNTTSQASWEMFRQFFGASNVEYSNGDHVRGAQDVFDSNYQPSGPSCNGFSTTCMINYQDIAQPNAGPYEMPDVEDLFSGGAFNDYADPITYYHAAQWSKNIIGVRRHQSREGTPQTVFEEIRHAVQNGSSGVIAIFHTEGGHTAGHALTPYRIVERADDADVFVYDSNHPGDNDRRVTFDFTSNTWSYQFEDRSLFNFFCLFGPDCVWDGGADDHMIGFEPLSMYIDQGVPWWTVDPSQAPALLVTVVGGGSTELGDGKGNYVGSGAGDRPGIPGAVELLPLLGWNPLQPFEAFSVPTENNYLIEHQNAAPDGVGVSVIGPGRLNRVRVGETTDLGASVTNRGLGLEFSATEAVPCTVEVARSVGDQGRSATWTLQLPTGTNSYVEADSTAGIVSMAASGGSTAYDLNLQILGSGRTERVLTGLNIHDGEAHSIALGDWSGIGAGDISIQVDMNGDGVPDRHLVSTVGALDMDPNTLNAKSKGQYVTCYIELRPPWTGATFIPSSVRLGSLHAIGSSGYGDANSNGVPDLMVKFDRAAALAMSGNGAMWYPEVAGQATLGPDTLYFAARDSVRVIRPVITAPLGGAVLPAGSTFVVRWSSPEGYPIDSVSVNYSPSYTAGWQLLSHGLPDAQSFAWVTPDSLLDSCYVAVVLYQGKDALCPGLAGPFSIGNVTAGVGEKDTSPLKVFYLEPIIPNPFRTYGSITFNLPEAADVRLRIYDVAGRLVTTLVWAPLPAGRHTVDWHPVGVAAGVYYCELDAEGIHESRKLLLLK